MHSFIFFLSIFTLVAGDFTPTAPGPGDVFRSGSTCTIQWQPGNWTNVTIALMTGSNTNMQHLTTVTTGLDGSDPSLTPYNWTCPYVSPNAAIYFYQFTNGDNVMDSRWTTRFTIASGSGSTALPENSTQPNGDAIPWGTGSLLNASDAANANDTTSQSMADNSYKSTLTAESPSSSSRMHKIHKTVFNDATSIVRQATPTINAPSDEMEPTLNSLVPTSTAGRPEIQAVSGTPRIKMITTLFGILTTVTLISCIIV